MTKSGYRQNRTAHTAYSVMSLRSDIVRCEKCGYTAYDHHQPIMLHYHLGSATIVTGRTMGWCHDCEAYVAIENNDLKSLRAKLSELKVEINRFETKAQALSKLFFCFARVRKQKEEINRSLEWLYSSLVRQEELIQLAETRQNTARCLCCWGKRTDRISFDNNSLANFTHYCGGRLRVSTEPRQIRFNISPVEYHLDGEGNLLL